MRSALKTSVKTYLGLSAALSLTVLLGGLATFVHLQNTLALKSETAMVRGGVSAFIERSELIVMDYGWWNEGLSRVEQRDISWLFENTAEPIEATEVYDLIAFDLADAAPFGWDQSNLSSDAPAPVLNAETADKIRSELILEHAAGNYIISRFINLHGSPTLLGATLMGDVGDRSLMDPASSPMIIIGYRLDDGFVEYTAAMFLLKDMMLQPELPDRAAAVEILDDAGGSAGFLTWTPSLPGMKTAQIAALPLTLAVVVFAALMALISVRAGRMATNAMQSELEAKTAARTDRLTDLDNRHGFIEHLGSEACRNGARTGGLSIVFFDLNGFKTINDNAGHAAGDFVLKEVAARFVSKLPRQARLARIGGDEFACVLTGPFTDSYVHDVAVSLVRVLEAPVVFEKAEYTVSAAVGYAVSRVDDPVDAEVLIHRADLAMYKAKSDGLMQPLAYSPELEIERTRRRAMLADLESGLCNGEIYVEYQPIVSAHDGQVTMLEVLARWNSPARGQVAPDEFIAIAEEYGFIHELGMFVLKSACDSFSANGRIPIAVNVSPIQLQDTNLCEKFAEIVARARVPASMIEIELTENVLIANPGLAKARLQQLSDAGFKISLDDYGTGFSSLGYLREFPFNKVKIDRSFVHGCGLDTSKSKVLQSLSLLAKAYDLKIVAEGVETEQEARLLRLIGYDFLQGFHFGRPMCSNSLAELHSTGAVRSAETA